MNIEKEARTIIESEQDISIDCLIKRLEGKFTHRDKDIKKIKKVYYELKYSNENNTILRVTPDFMELIKKGVKKKNNIVLLTKCNAKIIEELIKQDDDCFPFTECIFKYFNLIEKKSTKINRRFGLLLEKLIKITTLMAGDMKKIEMPSIEL